MKTFPCSPIALVTACFLLTLSACGSGAKKSSCQDECPSVGATECATAQVKTCQKDANGCLAWSTAADCPATQTCQGSACTCAVPCGSACCGAGAACIEGACCDTPCGSSCGCEEPQFCAVDATGNKACGFPCSTSGSCANASPGMTCCVAQPANADYPGACLAPPTDASAHVCKCNTGSDCEQGQSCAPASPAGIGGPLVCSPIDASPGSGCDGAHFCTSGYECWQKGTTDVAFCTNPCDSDSECPTGACCVKPPDVTWSSPGTPAKAGGCMPCP